MRAVPQGLRDAGDPAERAKLYEDTGGDEIVILDVSATPEGRAGLATACKTARDTARQAMAAYGCQF